MLSLDLPCLKRDLVAHLITHLKQAQLEVFYDASRGMKTPEGRADLRAEAIQVAETLITAQIVGGPWAVMDEWGTGSLMDTCNPALRDYINSELWNPDRRDTTIRSRRKGTYLNIFGQQAESRAPHPGVDLEKLWREGKLSFDLHLVEPSHALRTAMRWMQRKRFWDICRKALTTFPWHKYLIVKPTGR